MDKAAGKEEQLAFAFSPKKINLRTKTIVATCIILVLIIAIYVYSLFIPESVLKANFTQKSLAPSWHHLFGTDWLGRDMFHRTIKGMSTSMTIGLISAFLSALMAIGLGVLAAAGPKWLDELISWLIDLVMGIPHLVLLILISFAVGGGMKGVMIGVIVTHWTSLARLIRGEVAKLRTQEYVAVSKSIGKSNLWIMWYHFVPNLLPVFIVGLILLFPHAILHESSLSFLGFGLSPQSASIGIILAESMRYLTSGMWWLAVFPGAVLVLVVFLFAQLGENIKKLLDPYDAQE